MLASSIGSKFSAGNVRKYAASSNGRAELVVFGFVSVYVLVMSYYTVLQHNAFLTYWFDLGIYAQEFWLKLQGILGSNMFVFRPILFALVPLYAVFPRPETLLIAQSVILGLAAIPLYWFGRDELKSPLAGVVFAGALLLYPPLHRVNTFDFHVEAFLIPFFLFALYYLHRRQWRRYFLFTALLLTTMHEASLLVGAMGMYALLRYRAPWLRLRRHSFSVSLFWPREAKITLFTVVMAGAAYTVAEFLSSWSLGQFASSLLLQPDPIANRVLNNLSIKLTYIVESFGSLGFLAFLSPAPLVMALPWLGFSFLHPASGDVFWFSFQYGSFVTPFVFVAGVGGVRKLATSINSISISTVRRGVLLVGVTSLLFFQWLSPLAQPWPVVDERRLVLHRAIELIPDDASVLTQNELYPHLTGRYQLYGSISSEVMPEYILVDSRASHFRVRLSGPSLEEILPQLLGKGDYGILVQHDGIYLYQLGYHGSPISIDELLR